MAPSYLPCIFSVLLSQQSFINNVATELKGGIFKLDPPRGYDVAGGLRAGPVGITEVYGIHGVITGSKHPTDGFDAVQGDPEGNHELGSRQIDIGHLPIIQWEQFSKTFGM